MNPSPETPEAEARTPRGEGLKFATQLEWPVEAKRPEGEASGYPEPRDKQNGRERERGEGEGVNPTPTLGQPKWKEGGRRANPRNPLPPSSLLARSLGRGERPGRGGGHKEGEGNREARGLD